MTDELRAARFSVAEVLRQLNENPRLSDVASAVTVTPHTLRRCAVNLEFTFVLRLFGEFEAILRDYWAVGIGRMTEPDMQPLIDSIARRRNMDATTLDAAHDVRRYRNEIIHENLRDARLDFARCTRGVARYVSWLPIT